jgi:hypothetical protein
MRMDMRVQVPFKVAPSCKSAKAEVCSLPFSYSVKLIFRCDCTRYETTVKAGKANV